MSNWRYRPDVTYTEHDRDRPGLQRAGSRGTPCQCLIGVRVLGAELHVFIRGQELLGFLGKLHWKECQLIVIIAITVIVITTLVMLD